MSIIHQPSAICERTPTAMIQCSAIAMRSYRNAGDETVTVMGGIRAQNWRPRTEGRGGVFDQDYLPAPAARSSAAASACFSATASESADSPRLSRAETSAPRSSRSLTLSFLP